MTPTPGPGWVPVDGARFSFLSCQQMSTHRKYSGGTHCNTSQNVPPLMFFTYYTTPRVSLHRCRDRLRAYRDAGVQRQLIWPVRDDLCQLELFMQIVEVSEPASGGST